MKELFCLVYYTLSYRYFVILGTNTSENRTMPSWSNNPEPGQCAISNNTPNDVKENDNAPVMNAVFFISYKFKFLYLFDF